jgi:hypothetical protein
MSEERPDALPARGWREKLYLQGWRLWAVAAVLAYTLLGFLAVPWIARSQAPGAAREALGIDLAIERISFNPYLFKVEIDGLSADDPEMGTLMSFERFVVDFELASLWKRAWTFREIRLEGSDARVERFADGSVNFTRVLDRLPESPEEAPAEDTPPPRVFIESLSLQGGRAEILDHTRPTSWKWSLGPVSFSLTDFGTQVGEEGQYDLQITTERGGRMTWNGSLAVEPLRSAGSLRLDNIDVAKLWSYLEDDFDAGLNDADLDVGFAYEMDASGPKVAFRLADGRIDVGDLQVTRRSTGDSLLSLPRLSATGIDFDLAGPSLEIDAVEIPGPSLAVRRLEDGVIDLLAALAPAEKPEHQSGEPAESTPESGQAAAGPDDVGEEEDGAGELTINVGGVNLSGGGVTFEDRSAARPVTLSVQDLSIGVSDYRSAGGHQAAVTLSGSLASGGTFSTSGQIRAEPLDVGLDVKAADVSLMPVLPYADGTSNLEIDSIAAGLDGRVTLTDEEPFGFEGSVVARDFSSRLAGEDEPLVAWKRFDADGVKVSLAKNSVRVGAATLGQPFIRVRIGEDGAINLSRIAGGETGEDPGTTETPPAGDDGGAKDAIAVGVGNIQIIQGGMDFEDLSLPLPFRALVESMKGSVSAITSGSPTPARVEIDGDVNRYGAATIRGTLDLFDPTRLMDLAIDFRNILMPDLTPYSAKFAGRRIDDGRLDVDLTWSIRNSQLEASNRMVIQDLKLGEKVESPDAMNLPLDLAVGLLTDSEGKIDLDVPMKGDLDNPEFGYASLVFKALGNVLGKIVTAPFRFLASLVGGGDSGVELEFVGFVAGEAALLGPEQEDLDTLAGALAQRPELSLGIGAAFDRERDTRAIREKRLDARVAEKFEAEDAPDDGRDPVRGILEDLYTEAAGAEALSALAQAHTAKPEGQDAPVLDEGAYLGALRGELLALEPVPDEDLGSLATARAEAVRQRLETTGNVDPARLSVAAPAESPRADENLVYLKLDVAVE